MAENREVKGQVISNDVLPNDVLLAIFDFCVAQDQDPTNLARPTKVEMESWQPLVHVCRQWRSVIFGSPLRLNLRLVCTPKTPARDTLDVWPVLPLHIQGRVDLDEGLKNVIAVLERSDRVCVINVSSPYLGELSAAMQVPFPELTDLLLWSDGEVALPESFLGGSALRLQFLYLDGIPFLGLPKLLSSATHLVNLHLDNIPHSGYISPEAMLTALSTLTLLNSLMLRFQSPRSRPDRERRRLPPPTPAAFFVLTYFWFKGDSEYLDDLVAHIDAPRLEYVEITFFNDIVFDTPQLFKFICRTPRLKALQKARVIFGGLDALVKLSSSTSRDDLLHVGILCRELDWQVSSMEQVCTSTLPPHSVEDLDICEGRFSTAHWQDNIENVLWLELLRPFRAVKNLYLSKEFAPRIVPALQELAGLSAAEILPTLQNVFLEGLEPSGRVQEGIQQFVSTRQVTGDLIAVSPWDRGRG